MWSHVTSCELSAWLHEAISMVCWMTACRILVEHDIMKFLLCKQIMWTLKSTNGKLHQQFMNLSPCHHLRLQLHGGPSLRIFLIRVHVLLTSPHPQFEKRRINEQRKKHAFDDKITCTLQLSLCVSLCMQEPINYSRILILSRVSVGVYLCALYWLQWHATHPMIIITE